MALTLVTPLNFFLTNEKLGTINLKALALLTFLIISISANLYALNSAIQLKSKNKKLNIKIRIIHKNTNHYTGN